MTTTTAGALFSKDDSWHLFRKVPNAGTVLAGMQFPHRSDAHLWVVLVVWTTEDAPQYATWIYNSQTQGYSHGSYFTDMNERSVNRGRAYEDYAARCLTRVKMFCDWGTV